MGVVLSSRFPQFLVIATLYEGGPLTRARGAYCLLLRRARAVAFYVAPGFMSLAVF